MSNFVRCPICKQDPKTCPHSIVDMTERAKQISLDQRVNYLIDQRLKKYDLLPEKKS